MNRTIKFHIFESVESTQETAKRLVKDSQKLHAVLAFEQTQGKGTFGKSWLSPKDKGLYLTLAFELGHLKEHGTLSHLAAVATCLTLEKLHPKIKWPNDILVQDKKIAGILNEVSDHHVYCGIGINLIFDPSLKTKIDQPYTAFDGVKSPPDMQTLASELASNYLKLLEIWEIGGFKRIKDQYIHYFQYMMQVVTLDTPEGLISGQLVDFSDEGYPMLKIGTDIKTLTHFKHINKDN
jgi:BirA family transcriptional regulator, biotin operon repressor / biotin---[acetyl-CoA-carboxylase] ligase